MCFCVRFQRKRPFVSQQRSLITSLNAGPTTSSRFAWCTTTVFGGTQRGFSSGRLRWKELQMKGDIIKTRLSDIRVWGSSPFTLLGALARACPTKFNPFAPGKGSHKAFDLRLHESLHLETSLLPCLQAQYGLTWLNLITLVNKRCLETTLRNKLLACSVGIVQGRRQRWTSRAAVLGPKSAPGRRCSTFDLIGNPQRIDEKC